MKSIRSRVTMFVTGLALVAMQGCVSITGEPNVEKTTPTFETRVDNTNPFKDSVSVGNMDGFKGTSIIAFSGHVSPNMPEHSAREALENGMKNAGILAQKGAVAKYTLDVNMLVTGEEGMLSGANVFSGITRDMEVKYVLKSNATQKSLYDEIVKSTGKASCSNGDGCVSFYLVERVAAERSYKESFTKAINNIIALGVKQSEME